jgi:diguanylate cyclase (GGDEF)-like protein
MSRATTTSDHSASTARIEEPSSVARDAGAQPGQVDLTGRASQELANLNVRYEALVHSLERVIAQKQQLEHDLRETNARLERLASVDELTGLLNRRALEAALQRDMARADRERHAFSILLLDIDHFKRVNDTWGHQAGDAVLTMVGATLIQTLRGSDVAGRFGGEEFMCLLPVTDTVGAQVVAERLRTSLLERTVQASDASIRVTVSIGIATVCGPGCRAANQSIVRRADECLYRAKAEGRNRVVC